MNLKEFAKKIGISQPRASMYIRNGILKESVKRKGRAYEVDFEKAQKELRSKLDMGRAVKARITEKKQGSAKTKKNKQEKEKEKRKTVEQGSLSGIDFQTARTLNEQYKAALKKLEYDEKIKKLLPAGEIKAAWLRHISAAKTKILGIRSRVTPVVNDLVDDPDLSEIILQAIENEINGVLIELSKASI